MQNFQLKEEYRVIEAVQEAEQDALLSKSNVEGVGIGHKISNGVDTGEPCVSVFVSQKLDKQLLEPNQIIELKDKNFKVDVVETGVIFAGEAVTFYMDVMNAPNNNQLGIMFLIQGTVKATVARHPNGVNLLRSDSKNS